MLADAAHSVLLVSDLQPRLLAAMPAAAQEALRRNADVLITAANKLGIPVLATEQYPQGLGHTIPEIADKLTGSAEVFAKTCFSACGARDCADALAHSGRTQVVLLGVEAHICVLQTAFELKDKFAVFVVGDAVYSRAEAHRQNALARMRTGGIVISNTESVLFEWLRNADHKHFKALSALVK